MWKNAQTDGIDGEFLYKLEEGHFQTDFFVKGYDLKNKKVYLKPEDGNSDGVCLGTLSECRNGCHLSKSYPTSFLEMNGVDFSKNFVISVKEVEENIFNDPSVKRAHDLLNNHPCSEKEVELSKDAKKIMRKKLRDFEMVSLPFLKNYKFYRIDNIKHPFPLSSIDHVVFTKEFVSVFAKRGEWYVGENKDSEIFPLVIAKSENESDPMPLVSDSYAIYDDKETGLIYYIIGIGAFDDGQYFCKFDL